MLAYAGLRRELETLGGPAARAPFDLDPWVSAAEGLAPASARTRQRLAELLFLLGRPDEARGELREAVRLDPDRADEAVALLRRRGERAVAIVAALPPIPEVALAARPAFHADGDDDALAATLAARAGEDGWTPRLLRAWAEAERRAGAPHRALDGIDALRGRDDLEPERSLQRALTLEALDRVSEALAEARSAAGTSDAPDAWEILGVLERRAGAPDRAAEAFDRALHAVALRSGSDEVRARLYRRRGAAHEASGRLERAIVDYRRSLELDPGETDAARALDRLTGR